MKKEMKMILALVVVMCLAGIASAENFVIVTNRDDMQTDYVAFLQSLSPGSTVTLGAFDNIADAGQLATLQAADLIVISRHLSSGNYDGTAKEQAWNDLNVPILNHCSYLARDSRFDWLDGANGDHNNYTGFTVVDTEDTLFLSRANVIDGVVTMYSSAPGKYSIPQAGNAGNGHLIGNTPDGEPFLAYWEPGTVYHSNTSYAAGDLRVWLAGPEQNFFQNLTSDGQIILENAVAFLLTDGNPAEFNFPPTVSLEGTSFTQMFFDGSPITVDLAATATDDGNPADPGTTTITWTADPEATFGTPSAPTTTVTFTAPGIYTITVAANDGEKTATKAKTFRLVDDLSPMAYYPMDEIVDGNSLPDVAMGNDATLAMGAEPNLVEGWIGAGALEFYGNEYAQVNIVDDNDPNLNEEPRYGASVSMWIKVTEFDTGWQTAISKGDDSWRIARNDRDGNKDAMAFHCNGIPGNGPTPEIGSPGVNDGLWHHVVGTYNGNDTSLYTDGVLSSTMEADGYLINLSENPIVIGGQIDSGANSGNPRRLWNGLIDEVKVYNYGITAEQIREMSAQAMLPPVVQIGQVASPIVYRFGEALELPGTVDDYGLGGLSDVTIMWTTVSGPTEGTEAMFANPTEPATTASFPEFGSYTLRLTAIDAGINATVLSEVSLTLESPTCQDIIDAGLLQVGDLNSDCSVNLEDLAIMAIEWAVCVDPANPTCDWRF